jgi:hypothetical protein
MFKKIVLLLPLLLFSSVNYSYSGTYGEGKLQLTDGIVNYFIKYLRGGTNKFPSDFYVTFDGTGATYWFCSVHANCSAGVLKEDLTDCERRTGKKCGKFALKRYVKWKNGINPGKGKSSKFSSKWTDQQIKDKLHELGFYGNTTTTKKVEKKKEEKIVKKYSLEGKRSIALSWDGYSDLIAGTVEFDEANYKGILNLSLPNNDGTCEGSYSLQSDNKGTWQISCSNNMGAAGTLKWIEDGGVTGTGRDHNDKKVKFTISKNS